MTLPARPSPTARFLGVESASEHGPFSLLGLSPASCTPEQVNAALERQLARIDQHPEGDTPEADVARLAVHAAAAQLLDPAVRERLIARWDAAAPVPMPPPAAQAPVPVISPAEAAAAAREQRESNSTIVRFLLIGAAVVVVLFIGVLAVLTSGPARPSKPAAPAPAAPGPVVQTPATPDTSTAADTPAEAPPAPADRPPAASTTDAASVVRNLRAAAESVRKSPDAAATRFAEGAAWLASSWPRLDIAQRRAAIDAVLEYVYAAGNHPDASRRALEALSAGAQLLADQSQPLDRAQVWQAAWSSGILTRLALERDLTAPTAASIDRLLSAALGNDRPRANAGFETGAMAALARMPLRLLATAPARSEKDAGPFKPWIEAVASLLPDPALQERALADALELFMVKGPEPNTADGSGAFAAIQSLATQIKWRAKGPARARLLEWFRDQRISTADLHVLTSALATASGAEGVTPTMVLTATALAHEREQLRTEYATAWNVADAGAADEALRLWTDAAAAMLSRPTDRLDDGAELALAVELARLNQAARLRWSGDTLAASLLARDAGRVIDSATGPSIGPPAPGLGGGGSAKMFSLAPGGNTAAGTGDGEWALLYLSAGQNIPVRLERLSQLEQSGTLLGPVDAEVLAEAACFAQGGDGKVRLAAQRIAQMHARSPLMTAAMLEFLPRAPKIDSISDLIGAITARDLPPVTDPSWPLKARRALVERLIEQLAASDTGLGGGAGIDTLADLFARAYERPDGPAAQPPAPPSPGDPPRALNTMEIEALWRSLRAEAEAFVPNRAAPVPLPQIDSRRAGRKALAVGPIQAWAAEQVSLAEALAYIVTGEQPAREQPARTIMDNMAAQRRAAPTIFRQLRITEAAMLRLWLLRYDQEGAWSN